MDSVLHTAESFPLQPQRKPERKKGCWARERERERKHCKRFPIWRLLGLRAKADHYVLPEDDARPLASAINGAALLFTLCCCCCCSRRVAPYFRPALSFSPSKTTGLLLQPLHRSFAAETRGAAIVSLTSSNRFHGSIIQHALLTHSVIQTSRNQAAIII